MKKLIRLIALWLVWNLPLGKFAPYVMSLAIKSKDYKKIKEEKMICYKCKHRKKLQGDAHTKCGYPNATIKPIETGKKLNIKGDQHGINSGWFNWPFNFDPVWLECCEGYEEKEVNK